MQHDKYVGATIGRPQITNTPGGYLLKGLR